MCAISPLWKDQGREFMCRSVLTRAILGAAVTAMSATYANAQSFHTDFSGFFEVGALNNETGAIFSNGEATLKLKLDKKVQSLTYTLTYSNLSANVTQAHIHFGKVHVPGGIFLFLCSNLGNGPAGTPPCPANGGTVTGWSRPRALSGQRHRT
jgi:hypothetical protein